MRFLLIVMLVAFGAPALAQSTVNQGQGQSSGSKPWVVQGSTASTSTPLNVSFSATVVGETTEVLVTNAAGGTTVPASALASRRSIEIQNNGPNPIYCTVDGSAPVATTNGRWVLSGQAWSLDIGPLIVVRCIAGSAAQLTGAATMVTELR